MTFPLPWWVKPACAIQDFFWAVCHPLAWLDLVRRRRRRRAAWIAAGRPRLDQHAEVLVLGSAGNLPASKACCVEAHERLLPQFRFDCATCGHATNCLEHLAHVTTPHGAIPLEAILEERTRQVRGGQTP